jgi:hypothetical protein
MAFASAEVIFNAEVGEVNPVVEVRQLVLERPLRDLSGIAVRPSITVRAVPVVLLEERLLLAFQVLLENDAPNIGAVVS